MVRSSFVLGAEKEVYWIVIPRLMKGGMLVADKAFNNREAFSNLFNCSDKP
jgi:hypothetical protein